MTKEYLNKDPLVVLKEVWGYDDFRENQLEAIQTIINQKNDILYLARTSAGKSIVYQLPSLVLDGVALIVSPLLSLMEDQVSATQNKGIRAYTINSTIGIREKRKIFEALEKNEVDLLFMAPESIVNLEFLDFLKDKCKISFVAADESHCYKGSSKISTDKGLFSFKELHNLYLNNEVLPKALSVKDGKTSYNQIINVFQNQPSDMIQINLTDRSNLKITKSHSLFTKNGEKLAGDLSLNDELVTYIPKGPERPLNNNQLSFVIGSILGDGGCDKKSDTTMRIKYVHSLKQLDYLNWKKDFIGNFTSNIYKLNSGYTNNNNLRAFNSKVFKVPEAVESLSRGTLRKDFPNWIFENFDEKALSIWIMDDGSYKDNSYIIHCNSFSKDLTEKFINLIKSKFNIESYLKISRTYYEIKFSVKESEKLKELIKPYIHPNLSYKIGIEYNNDFIDWKDNSIPLETINICSIKNIEHNEEFLYDIEVENNHNYFVHTTRGDTEIPIHPILSHNCTSQWGSDFRPKYRSFAKVLRTILDVPFIALTATADERTVEDIKVAFNFSEESDKPLVTFTQDLDRPSITYNVMEKSGNGLKQIKEIIDSYPKNTSGIIYCTTRKQVEELQFQLYKLGYKSVAYHAGMKKKQKQESFEKWMTKKAPIAVCTIAFGLGIDKADVRFVINQCIPSSIEDLIQLWGRASRDGEPSQAFVLYDKKDVTLLQWMMKQSTVNQNYLKIQLDKLHQVHTLVQSKDCIRKQMLNYFGQNYEHENCNSCSNCMTSVPI